MCMYIYDIYICIYTLTCTHTLTHARTHSHIRTYISLSRALSLSLALAHCLSTDVSTSWSQCNTLEVSSSSVALYTSAHIECLSLERHSSIRPRRKRDIGGIILESLPLLINTYRVSLSRETLLDTSSRQERHSSSHPRVSLFTFQHISKVSISLHINTYRKSLSLYISTHVKCL